MIKEIYNYIIKNKTPQMWEHYCKVEQDVMGIEKGKPCNWCDLTEKNKEYPRDGKGTPAFEMLITAKE